MENVASQRLQSIKFGEVQTYKSIAILPLLAADGVLRYRTLGEALATSDITITEVSGAGSVPELLVINRGGTPVLLLDGEELAGAKQNRVLNTSILLKEHSEARIPVSCTEQGRWSYASASFADSGNVMALKGRARKSSSVSSSLDASASYRSDQGEVWHEIAELQAKAGFQSPTSAMSDVFKARAEDLRKCVEVFRCVPGQVGLVVFTEDGAVGFDLVSLSSAYEKLHPKLVRSYALESLLESPGAKVAARDFAGLAQSLLESAGLAQERRFPSVGCGFDCRYRSEALAGAALEHEDEVVHAAFFRLGVTGPPDAATMASLRNRRRYTNE